MPRVRNSVTSTMAVIIASEELVIEASMPPICMSTIRWIANCSRGLAPSATSEYPLTVPVHFLGRPEHVEQASHGTKDEEHQQEQRQGAQPPVEQPADASTDRQGHDQLDADAEGKTVSRLRRQGAGAGFALHLIGRPLAQPAQAVVKFVQPCCWFTLGGFAVAHRSHRSSGPTATILAITIPEPQGGGTLRLRPSPVKRQEAASK